GRCFFYQEARGGCGFRLHFLDGCSIIVAGRRGEGLQRGCRNFLAWIFLARNFLARPRILGERFARKHEEIIGPGLPWLTLPRPGLPVLGLPWLCLPRGR